MTHGEKIAEPCASLPSTSLSPNIGTSLPSSSFPSRPAPSLPGNPTAPSVSTALHPSGTFPDPPPFVTNPKLRGRGPAKVYEKSRSSQRIEDRNNPPKEGTKTNSPDRTPDDDDDEAQARDELEPESGELTQDDSTFLATGEDPESYEQAINSVDRNDWQAAMQDEMDSIITGGKGSFTHQVHAEHIAVTGEK